MTERRSGPGPDPGGTTGGLDRAAAEYVRLALAVGRHDPNYVDFYLGPGPRASRGRPEPLPRLLSRARDCLEGLRRLPPSARREFLAGQMVAMEAYLRILSGEGIPWKEQIGLLYGVAPQDAGLADLEQAIALLEERLPGRGPLAARLARFRREFRIPSARLARVVNECLAMLRDRTRRFVSLPRGERITIGFVRRKPWMAYNWYLGKFSSRIEINLDFPSHPSEILHVLAHEAYPGHHAYHSVCEDVLLRREGRREFSIYTVFSPQALVSEGLSEVSMTIVMTRAEILSFMRDRIAPLAGLEGRDFESYMATCAVMKRLAPAAMEAARLLAEEDDGRRRALAFLTRSGFSRKQSLNHLRFFRRFPAYICTYSEGERLVRSAVGSGSGAAARYFDLFRRPRTPAEMLDPAPAGPAGTPV